MGFVLLGVYSGSLLALQGVVIQMLAHGVSTGALFILCGELYERIHTRDLSMMGGLWKRLPLLSAVALFFAVASLGLPGLGNFLGEFLILAGTFRAYPVLTAVSALGLIMAAAYSLIMVQKAFQGTPAEESPLEDLTGRELSMMALLVALLLWLGLYPQLVLDTADASLQPLVQAMTPSPGAADSMPAPDVTGAVR
jgi:NADH-quinone oxidoreductase subunit M